MAEALKALEWAGVLTWQHRLTRIRERCTDLFGRVTWRWRVIRTSNSYTFRDPQAAVSRGVASKSENQTGTRVQENAELCQGSRTPLPPALQAALARFGAAIADRLLTNSSGGEVEGA